LGWNKKFYGDEKMPLSCSCDYDFEPGALLSYPDDDFTRLKTERRKRCESCKCLININNYALGFSIVKIPEHQIEINIYGEDGEMPRARRYLCEKCGEIFLNLGSVGFECIWCGEDMLKLLKEYQASRNAERLIRSFYDPPDAWLC
jgi:hypothetical protein